MSDPIIQRLYSQLVVRGYRNTPTYAEVKRDNRELAGRIDPIVGYRF